MKSIKKSIITVGLLFITGFYYSSIAQESVALIDKLVEKGVLTSAEGDEVRTKLSEEWNQTGASKVDAGKLLKNMNLFGDIRLRYEYTDQQNAFDQSDDGVIEPDGADSRDDVSRMLYRVRFGIKVNFADNLEFGLRLGTGSSSNPATGNQVLGDLFLKDSIFVDQAYLKYQPWEWAAVWAGKFEQPFWTTDMYWSREVTVEGFAQQFKYKPWGENTELFMNLAQLIYQDVAEADEDNTDTGGNRHGNFADDGSRRVINDDGWVYAAQFGVDQKIIGQKLSAKAAVGYWYWANGGDVDANGTAPGSGNNLGGEFQILDFLAEITYRPFDGGIFKDIPFRPYTHLIWNMAPAPNLGVTADRPNGSTSDAINNPDDIDELNTVAHWRDISNPFAWRAGLRIGEAKKRGQWEINAFYQEVGSDAVPDTFNDNSIAAGLTNNKGIGIMVSYAFRDWWAFGINYYDFGWLDPDINQDINRNTTAEARTLQIETSVKF